MSLGHRLKECRRRKKVTQEELSKDLNINRSTYAKYETGENEPDIATIRKLADYFGVKVDYLVTGHENSDLGQSDLSPEDRAILEKIKNDPNLDLFFKDFSSAPEEHQRDLVKIWKALYGKEQK